jgi:hypothetical protein
MSVLDLDLEGAVEPTIVEANEEYELRIMSCLKRDDKNGYEYIMPFFEIIEEPIAKEFGKFMYLPDSGRMSEKELNKCKWTLTVFCDSFGIDHTKTIDHEADLPGLTGWAILGLGTDRDGEECNTIKKFVAPK